MVVELRADAIVYRATKSAVYNENQFMTRIAVITVVIYHEHSIWNSCRQIDRPSLSSIIPTLPPKGCYPGNVNSVKPEISILIINRSADTCCINFARDLHGDLRCTWNSTRKWKSRKWSCRL